MSNPLAIQTETKRFENYEVGATTTVTTTTTVITTTTATTTVVENVNTTVSSLKTVEKAAITSGLEANVAQEERSSPIEAVETQAASGVLQGTKEPSSSPADPDIREDTHLHIDATNFIKNILNGDDAEYDSVVQVSHIISGEPGYRELRQQYVKMLQPLPTTSTPEALLMSLFNYITDMAPSCGLQKPYPLKIKYLSQEYKGKETAQCAGVLQEAVPPQDGGWPVIVIHTHKANFERLEATDPPADIANDLRFPKRKRQSSEPPLPGAFKKARQASPIPSVAPPVPVPPEPPKHKIISSPITPDTSQLIKDAFNVMRGLGTRRHILGILVKGLDFFFCYYDRAGSISSSRVHLIDDSPQVIAAIVSLALCTPTRFGFEPCIRPPPQSLAATSIRGCSIEVEGQRLELDTRLHSSGSAFGRGTVVFSAHPSTEPTGAAVSPFAPIRPIAIPDVVVVKLSWQIVTQDSEDAFFRRAAKFNVEGVAQLYLSSVIGALSNGVRGKVAKLKAYVDRELRVQVMGPLCIPLYKVPDLEDFKIAFVSLVKAHHELYTKAGILHRDISINNLMVDSSNHRSGVLIDFDLAVVVKDEAGNEITGRPIVTGTFPFLAVDLLFNEPGQKSYYRHDLESFLYVLLWITTHYDRGEEVITDEFAVWYSRPWLTIAQMKLGCIASGYTGLTRAQYQSLGDTWLPDLCDLFSSGFAEKQAHDIASQDKISGIFDYGTLGGHVTYEHFMEIILS